MTSQLKEFSRKWSTRTLEDFRGQAVLEESGISYEALVADGKRMFLALCVTGEKSLGRLLQQLDMVDDGKEEDWNNFSLGTMLERTMQTGGLGFEPLRGSGGTFLAIALMAAGPDSVVKLERLFGL